MVNFIVSNLIIKRVYLKPFQKTLDEGLRRQSFDFLLNLFFYART